MFSLVKKKHKVKNRSKEGQGGRIKRKREGVKRRRKRVCAI